MARFFAGMVCGAGILFVAMHYHVVRGNNGIVLVPKVQNGLSDIYTDIREYELQDWRSHKSLAAAIMQSNHSGLVQDSAQNSFGGSVAGMVDSLLGAK